MVAIGCMGGTVPTRIVGKAPPRPRRLLPPEGRDGRFSAVLRRICWSDRRFLDLCSEKPATASFSFPPVDDPLLQAFVLKVYGLGTEGIGPSSSFKILPGSVRSDKLAEKLADAALEELLSRLRRPSSWPRLLPRLLVLPLSLPAALWTSAVWSAMRSLGQDPARSKGVFLLSCLLAAPLSLPYLLLCALEEGVRRLSGRESSLRLSDFGVDVPKPSAQERMDALVG